MVYSDWTRAFRAVMASRRSAQKKQRHRWAYPRYSWHPWLDYDWILYQFAWLYRAPYKEVRTCNQRTREQTCPPETVQRVLTDPTTLFIRLSDGYVILTEHQTQTNSALWIQRNPARHLIQTHSVPIPYALKRILDQDLEPLPEPEPVEVVLTLENAQKAWWRMIEPRYLEPHPTEPYYRVTRQNLSRWLPPPPIGIPITEPLPKNGLLQVGTTQRHGIRTVRFASPVLIIDPNGEYTTPTLQLKGARIATPADTEHAYHPFPPPQTVLVPDA